MNYNAKHGDGAPGVRRIQRVSDVNAMGYSAPLPSQQQNQFAPNAFGAESSNAAPYNYNDQINMDQNSSFAPNYSNQPQPNQYYDPYSNAAPQYGQTAPVPTSSLQQPISASGPTIFNPNAPNPANNFPSQFSMLQQPMVQDMALQYGQRLADQGKQLVETQIEKYVPVTRLKYYFAVDNNYVVRKLILLLFPFHHRDWSLKYDQDNPVQPRYDLNAPDLYIPTMAYITFIVLAGLVMGMQNKFTPSELGVISSSAFAYTLVELIAYWLTLYIFNLSATMKLLDLLAFSGYKFVAINLCILVSIVFKSFGYYLALLYTGFSLCFFLLRTLKAKMMRESTGAASYDAYGNVQQADVHTDYSIGRKRKLYFLLFISFAQPLLSFWLSWHLIPSKTVEAAVTVQ
ncbi:protein YIF1B [Sitodiplosis mosellana]|uniref:protein YIF1B n=1 Tax=Sitodiplosis mosellana TaxID=263140 RepID=UPI002443E53A|nr:protein YIF1B [Sitodiplosis mosellana]